MEKKVEESDRKRVKFREQDNGSHRSRPAERSSSPDAGSPRSNTEPEAMDAQNEDYLPKQTKRPADRQGGRDEDEDESMVTSLIMQLREMALQDMEGDLETGAIPRPVCEARDELQDPEYLETYFCESVP